MEPPGPPGSPQGTGRPWPQGAPWAPGVPPRNLAPLAPWSSLGHLGPPEEPSSHGPMEPHLGPPKERGGEKLLECVTEIMGAPREYWELGGSWWTSLEGQGMVYTRLKSQNQL